MSSEEENKKEYHFIEFEEKKDSLSKLKIWICIFFAIFILLFIIILIIANQMFVDHYDVLEKTSLDDNNMMEYEGHTYQIVFESDALSSHTGKVRHISMSHEKTAPMFTHDILITTGEYADETFSTPLVEDHHATHYERNGTLNLIHAVPENKDIYEQILDMELGDIVTIEGYEILYLENLESRIRWQDAGCNSMYITSIRTE